MQRVVVRVLIKLGVATLAMAMVAGLSGPATSEAAAQTGVRCWVNITDSVPTVIVYSDLDNGRAAVERRAFDRYWWRGVSDLSDGDFRYVDTPLPQNAARVDYRVVVRDGNKVIATANCEFDRSSNCDVVAEDNKLVVYTPFIGDTENLASNDVVVRRSVNGGQSWWRGVARRPHSYGYHGQQLGSGYKFTDTAPANGSAQYHALGRINGVIHTVFTCGELTLDPECTPIDVHGLVNPLWGTNDDETAMPVHGALVRILHSADNFDGFDTLIVDRPSLGTFACASGVDWVVIGPDGLAHFASNDGHEVGLLNTNGIPSYRLVLSQLQTAASYTDHAVFALRDDTLLRIDRGSRGVSWPVWSDSSLRTYSTQNMATHPNGNVYFVMENRNDLSRFLMEWNDTSEQARVVAELSNQSDDPAYIAVSRDGSAISLLGVEGAPNDEIPIG